MKKGFNESFDSRLLKYSIAAGIALGTGAAEANVVVKSDSVTVSGSSGNYAISFNGTNYFRIRHESRIRPHSTSHGYNSTTDYILIGPYTNNAGWIYTGRTNPKPLASNSSVGGNHFKDIGNTAMANWIIRTYRSKVTRGYSFVGSDKYIGVRFNIGTEVHYGWIKVHVNSGAASILIISHAYETNANTSINSPLPVELTAFTTNNLGDKVELIWHTATEVNNYGFEIQRAEVSGQKSDAGSQSSINNRQWSKIGFVKGNGNSNSPKNYSFIDDNPPSGKVDYRLKQIDNDGSFKYSSIVEASFMEPNKFELSQNYPNPFNPTTTIQYAIPKSEHVTLKVYDELGREVSTLVNENKEAGQHRVNFNGANLASGIYYYRISAGDFTEVKKLMLLK